MMRKGDSVYLPSDDVVWGRLRQRGQEPALCEPEQEQAHEPEREQRLSLRAWCPPNMLALAHWTNFDLRLQAIRHAGVTGTDVSRPSTHSPPILVGHASNVRVGTFLSCVGSRLAASSA